MRSRIPALVFSLVLSSCMGGREPGLPSAEVLQNAALQSQNLESASFTFEGFHKGVSAVWDGTLHLKGGGRLQNAGREFAADVTMDGEGDEVLGDTAPNLHAEGAFAVAGKDDVYVKLDSLKVEPTHPLWSSAVVQSLLGKWLLLPPASSTPTPAGTVAPDPSFLRAQAHVVAVTRDDGFMTVHGRKTYHYDVALDPTKLAIFLAGEPDGAAGAEEMSALAKRLSGELWIDTETFFLHRVRWHLSSDAATRSGEAEFTIDLTEHNAAAPIGLPTDAQPLLMELQQFPGTMAAPLPLDGAGQRSPAEDELLKNLLQEAVGTSSAPSS